MNNYFFLAIYRKRSLYLKSNDLIEYFIQRDKEEARFTRDLFGIGSKIAKKIDTILEE